LRPPPHHPLSVVGGVPKKFSLLRSPIWELNEFFFFMVSCNLWDLKIFISLSTGFPNPLSLSPPRWLLPILNKIHRELFCPFFSLGILVSKPLFWTGNVCFFLPFFKKSLFFSEYFFHSLTSFFSNCHKFFSISSFLWFGSD